MLKFGSAFAAIPSSVKKVRIKRMMYGGVRKWYVADSLAKPVANAPNRLLPPASLSNWSLIAKAISSKVHSTYGTFFLNASSGFLFSKTSGVKPTSWNTNANWRQSPEIMLCMPFANPSMIFPSTSAIKPKSRKTKESSEMSNIMFPS